MLDGATDLINLSSSLIHFLIAIVLIHKVNDRVDQKRVVVRADVIRLVECRLVQRLGAQLRDLKLAQATLAVLATHSLFVQLALQSVPGCVFSDGGRTQLLQQHSLDLVTRLPLLLDTFVELGEYSLFSKLGVYESLHDGRRVHSKLFTIVGHHWLVENYALVLLI